MKTILLVLCIVICIVIACAFSPDNPPIKPDSRLTPGVTVSGVPVETILAHGYTARPGVRNVSGAVHREVFVRYFGAVPDHPERWEVDHLISLELGGANVISNLWPQPYFTHPYNARDKDKLENAMARELRALLATNGPVTASNVMRLYQHQIATNWTAEYDKRYGHPKH